MYNRLYNWIDRNIFTLGRGMRLSFLPPLIVYLAYGMSGMTSIVSTFFVKDYLGISAEQIAILGFWATLPWCIKIAVGHVVDLIWRWNLALIIFGATLIATGTGIIMGLLASKAVMVTIMSPENWYIASIVLTSTGYMIQDCIADGMTVEAVPTIDEHCQKITIEANHLMHTTMQTLGRIAFIVGTILVAAINLYLFKDVDTMNAEAKHAMYLLAYRLAMLIPIVSVLGVLLAYFLQFRELRLRTQTSLAKVNVQDVTLPDVDYQIIWGGALLFLLTMLLGLSQVYYSQELIFVGSVVIVMFLIQRLMQVMETEARSTLIGTALIIFVYRAIPNVGEGVQWWMIGDLGFNERFLSVLSLISSIIALFGLFYSIRFIAGRSIVYVIIFLTIAGTILNLPTIGIYYGIDKWTAAITGGVVNSHLIMLVNTALESPLVSIAMIPMLAWIAKTAPQQLKATYFSLVATLMNLAMLLSQLLTKYLNQVFTITRTDYSELGLLMLTAMMLGLVMPLAALLLVHVMRLRSA